MKRVAFAGCLIAGAAMADPLVPNWIATRGALEPGRLPGSFLIATEAAPAQFSEGEVIAATPVQLPYRLDVTWRRLGPEAGRSMHVTVASGVVLIKSGQIALYAFDEAEFARHGWRPLRGYDAHAEHAVSVTQDRVEVRVRIDGSEVARFPLTVGRPSVQPGVGLKGATAFRSTLYVRSLAVHQLQ